MTRESRHSGRCAHGGRQRERQRNQPGVGIARLRELRRLRDVFAEHELGSHAVVQPLVPQCGHGGASVRSMLGIRDRDPANARFGQDRQPAGEVKMCVVAGPEDDPAARVLTSVPGTVSPDDSSRFG